MQELGALVPFLIFLALLVALSIARRRQQESARRRAGEALGRPPGERVPEGFRIGPRTVPPGPEPVFPPKAPPTRPQPEGPRRAPAGVSGPPPARRRMRRVLKDPQGRRLAILAHEILRRPAGLGREAGRAPGAAATGSAQDAGQG
jgi:hypothetical protein